MLRVCTNFIPSISTIGTCWNSRWLPKNGDPELILISFLSPCPQPRPTAWKGTHVKFPDNLNFIQGSTLNPQRSLKTSTVLNLPFSFFTAGGNTYPLGQGAGGMQWRYFCRAALANTAASRCTCLVKPTCNQNSEKFRIPFLKHVWHISSAE